MIIGGTWYLKVPRQSCTNIPYKLLLDFGLAFVYSHLVIVSKFSMFPCATRKGYRNFFISPKVRKNLVATIEDKQSIEINF
jgi:hypothetical protein